MRSPIANPGNIVIPSSAVPGQARIEIGTILPSPLNTYVPSVFVNAQGFAGAIIFYSEGDDSTYVFLAVVEDVAGSDIAATIHGSVVNGVLQELNPGEPLGSIFGSVGGGTTLRLAASGVTVSADQAAVLQSISGDLVLQALGIGGLVHADQAGGALRIQAAGPTVVDLAFQANGETTMAGAAGTPTTAWWTTFDASAESTGGLALAVGPSVLIPGCTLVVNTVTAGAKWSAAIAAYFEMTVAGVTKAFGELYVDGVSQSEIAVLNCNAAGDGGTVAQNYSGIFATAGAHTFELRARKSLAAGTVLAQSPHCTVAARVMETGG